MVDGLIAARAGSSIARAKFVCSLSLQCHARNARGDIDFLAAPIGAERAPPGLMLPAMFPELEKNPDDTGMFAV